MPTDPLDQSPRFEPDPVIAVYKKHVDTTLLVDHLRGSARDRLELMIAGLALMEELRRVAPKKRR